MPATESLRTVGRDSGRPSCRPLVRECGVTSAGDAACLGRSEAGGDVGPVHDVPQRVEEVCLDVLILKVERVLPGIEDQKRRRAVADVALVVVDLFDDEAATERLPREDAPT